MKCDLDVLREEVARFLERFHDPFDTTISLLDLRLNLDDQLLRPLRREVHSRLLIQAGPSTNLERKGVAELGERGHRPATPGLAESVARVRRALPSSP